MNDLVIIGSGLAGYSLAKEWRKLDIKSSLTIITADQGEFYSKPQLSNALAHGRDPQQIVMSTVEHMRETLQAEIITQTRVLSIEPQQKICQCDNGQSIRYQRLILANGAYKITPPLQGDAVLQLMSVNNLDDYRRFRKWIAEKKHIVILGAGLVGCEFANDLLNLNCKVSIVAPEHTPLVKFVPQPIGRCLIDALSAQGVDWHLGKLAEAVNHTNDGLLLQLNDGSVLKTDGVMCAIGLRAASSLAQSADLNVDHGVVVDTYLRSSDPYIYALGDCAQVNGFCLQYIAPLLQCARALAKILAGEETPVHYPAMPVLVKTPTCPIISCLPLQKEQDGEWCYDGKAPHLRAQWFDANGKLMGFALAGETMHDRMTLLKAIPNWF